MDNSLVQAVPFVHMLSIVPQRPNRLVSFTFLHLVNSLFALACHNA